MTTSVIIRAGGFFNRLMKSFKHYLPIVAISLLPFFFIFATIDLPHTHLPRIAAYVKAVTDGHIPVRWAGDLNYNYGLPLFNFIYQVPYALASLFVIAGMNLVLTYKMVLLISFLLSGIGMYAFASHAFNDRRKALLVAVFYQFAPFHLVEIFTRGSIGSLYAYAFLPFVLWSVSLVAQKKSIEYFFLSSVATALLVLSHNSLSLVFFGISTLYVFLFFKKQSRMRALGSLLAGLALAAFYWIPALFEHKYTYGDLYMKDVYMDHFPPLWQFFVPNFTDNAKLHTAGMTMQLGIFHTLALFASVSLLWTKRVKQHTLRLIFLFSLFLISTALFFMQPISGGFWQASSFLRQFQFPWRLLAVTTFATSLLSVSLFSLLPLKKNLPMVLLISLTILTTMVYWQLQEGYDRNINEKDYWNYSLNTTYYGETDLIWSAGPAKSYPAGPAQVIDGIGEISAYTKKTQEHSFSVRAETDVRLVDHTQYFPGWRVYVDGQKIPIEFQDANWRGLLTFAVPEGNHEVRVAFGESKIRIIADLLSLGTAAALLLAFLWNKRKHIVSA